MPSPSPGAVQADGVTSFLGGQNAGIQPSLIQPNQYAVGINVTARNGYVGTRPGWVKQTLNFSEGSAENSFLTGNPQGLKTYQSGNTTYLMACLGGRQYAIDPVNGFNGQNITPSTGPNSSQEPKAFMCQADDYFIIQDGSSKPIIIQGLTSRRATDTEVPVGTCMAYGWGRLWVSQKDQFVAGDILGGTTSVISFTETIYFAEGGAFRVPATVGQINGMSFIPLQDTATGQGQLLIGADYGIASVNGGIPRAQWKETQIQQIAQLDVGWVGQDNNCLLNGDIFYRSNDGIRSYRMARAQQGLNTNTPQSNEVSNFLNTDTQQFLKYGSGVYFDGRILMTTGPVWRGTYCYHKGLVVLDSQPQQSISGKAPPVWDGMWDGLNIVQITKGIFNKVERCFALVRKIDDTIISTIQALQQTDDNLINITVNDSSVFEVDGIYQSGSSYIKVLAINGDFSIAVVIINGPNTSASLTVGATIIAGEYNEIWELTTDSPFDIRDDEKGLIGCKLWTRSFTHGSPLNQKRIVLGELQVQDVIGTVNWSIKYRPDQYPCMYPFKTGTVCSEFEVCEEQCPTNLNRHPSYKPRLLFSPSENPCNPVSGNVSTLGYEFQWLIEWEGHWKIRGIRETCNDVTQDTKGNC